MLFTELVLQGVRNFSQTHRFPLGEGFTVFVGDAGAGKSTFVDVLVHILFPDTTELSTDAFRSSGSDVCRAALTIDDGRGQLYRLVKDLLRGSTALTRFDQAAGQFAPVSASAAEILQYLSSTLHLPQRDIFEGIYVTRGSELPSSQAGASAGGGMDMGQVLGVGAPPGAGDGNKRRLPPSSHFQDDSSGGPKFPGYQGGDGEFDAGGEILPDDPEEIRSQIEILQRDLTSARMVDDTQFRLDGLQSEMFEIEQKSKGVRAAQKRIEQIVGALRPYDRLTELPGDFEARVKDYEQGKERYQRDVARIRDERRRWEKTAEQSQPGALSGNRNFVLGMTGGLVAILAGVAGFFVMESLRWVALADMVLFGIAVVAAMRHIDSTMGVERSQARLVLIDERRQKLDRQFELESSIVRKTMDQVEVESPAQILELYKKRNHLQADLGAAEQELVKQKAQPGLANAEARKTELQKDIDECEAQLSGLSGLMMGPTEMERKLDLLRDKLAYLEGGGQAGAGSVGGASGFDLGVGAPPGAAAGQGGDLGGGGIGLENLDSGAQPGDEGFGQQRPDLCKRLVKLAEDLFLVDAEKLNGMLSPRASQFVAAMTAKSITHLMLDARGEVQVFDAASGASRASSGLPLEMQDLVYLALKFTMIEVFSKQQPIPVFLDEPFVRTAVSLHELNGRILAGIARSTQLVLFSSQSGLAQHATSSFSL